MECPEENLLKICLDKGLNTPSDSNNAVSLASNGAVVAGEPKDGPEEAEEVLRMLLFDSYHSLSLAKDVDTRHGEVSTEAETGYGWVVVVSALFINMLTSGLFMVYGLYLPDLTEYFQKSQASMAIFMSVESIIICVSMFFLPWLIGILGDRAVCVIGLVIAGLGTLASSFCERYGTFVFTFGVIRTIGTSLMILPPNMVVQKYFRRRRALAAGISSMGLSGGVLCFSPLQRVLINTFGWRGSLLLFSAFVFQGIVPAALLRPPRSSTTVGSSDTKSEIEGKSNGNSKISKHRRRLRSVYTFLGLSVMREKWVLLFIGAKCCAICGMVGMYKFAFANAVYYGIDTMKASMLPALLGLGSTICRLAGGSIGSLKPMRHRRLLLYGVANIMNATVLIIASFAKEQFIFHAACCLTFGFTIGLHESVSLTVIADLFGITRMTKVASWVLGLPGASLCLLLPLMGYLCDVTGTFQVSMLLAGGIHVAGGAMFLTLLVPSHKVTTWDVQQGMIQQQRLNQTGS